jgi:hypothetical protein
MYCGKELPKDVERCPFCFEDEAEETESIPTSLPRDPEGLKEMHQQNLTGNVLEEIHEKEKK